MIDPLRQFEAMLRELSYDPVQYRFSKRVFGYLPDDETRKQLCETILSLLRGGIDVDMSGPQSPWNHPKQ